MNIYNFIYCFFYLFWEKRGNDGRMVGSAHVLFTIMMQFLLLSEIIHDLTGFNIVPLPNYGGAGINKYMYLLILTPFLVALIIYYNKNRTKKLLKDYHENHGNAGRKNTLKILLYVVLPMILGITLAIIRQRNLI
jgi:hypothetical protein